MSGCYEIDGPSYSLSDAVREALHYPYHNLYDFEIEQLLNDLLCDDYRGVGVINALSYARGGDIDEDEYRACVARFKRKWLASSAGERLERHKNELMRYANELAESLEPSCEVE